MSLLDGGESPFRDDDGSAEPRVAAALAAFGSGLGSEHAALTALAASRLLVPIVAAQSEPEGRGAAWTEERGTSDEGRRRLWHPEASEGRETGGTRPGGRR